MPRMTHDLTALLGSRICHDLISPLGAIGNGLELLSMSGTAGPEMALLSDSVANANAKIRFFRVAFGAAGEAQSISRAEIQSILGDLSQGSKLRISWQHEGGVPRRDAKLVFLMLQCFESAMPYGGDLTVRCEDGGWQMTGIAAKLKVEPELWALLTGETEDADISAGKVHFALAAEELHDRGRQLQLDQRDQSLAAWF